MSHLEFLLKRHQAGTLQLNLGKFTLRKNETTFLAFILSMHGVKPNPNKIQLNLKCSVPADTKTMRQVLGIESYYKRFICNYAKQAYPLQKLVS